MELSGLERRRAERELFDSRRTAHLQDDEIMRLNAELRVLLKRIAEREDHVSGSDSILKRRRDALRSKIADIPKILSIKKAKMISEHTQSMRDLREAHDKKLRDMQRQYQDNISETSVLGSEDDLVSSISSTRSRIADILEMKSEKKELNVQGRIERISARMDEDRKRAKQLEMAIDQLRNDLERTKGLTASRVMSVNMTTPEIDTTLEEERLILEKANMISEENAWRQEAHKAVESLRTEITKTRANILKLKQKIRDGETPESDALKRTSDELGRLKTAHGNLLSQRKDMIENGPGYKVRCEEERHTSLEVSLESARLSLLNAQREYDTIRNELRRLDFMVYGRSGKYQRKSSSKCE